MEFFNWSMLGTYAGAVTAVGVFTQLTKSIPGIKNIPTQIWSYVISAIILILAQVFDGECTVQGFVLAALNAGIISLAANGGYEALTRDKETR